MQDKKPPDWADRGTARGGTPKSTGVDSANGTSSTPRSDRRAVNSPHQTGTPGRKTFPKLPRP